MSVIWRAGVDEPEQTRTWSEYLSWRDRMMRAAKAQEDQECREALADLRVISSRFDAPMLKFAITGTAAQIRAAAGIVRLTVEEYGSKAPDELEAMAGLAQDSSVAVNLARAASALRDDPAGLSAVQREHWTSHVDQVRGETRSRRPRRRR